MKKAKTKVIIGAMYELANTIQSDDGVANAACIEAATRLEEQQIALFKTKKRVEALKKNLVEVLCRIKPCQQFR